MDASVSALLQQLWPLALVMLGLGFLIKLGKAQNPRTGAAGKDAAAPQDQGVQHFNGTSRGVAWTAEILNLSGEVDDGQANRVSLARSYTRWSAPEVRNPGSPVLLMPLPEGIPADFSIPPEDGGLLAGLADKAGSIALAGFLLGRFGAQRVAGLSFPASQRVALAEGDFGGGYAAWCGQPEQLARLADVARSWFAREIALSVALLWDARGLTLHWPEGRSDPESVTRIAERGAELALVLQAWPQALRAPN